MCVQYCRSFLWGGNGKPIEHYPLAVDATCSCVCDSNRWVDYNILGKSSCVPRKVHVMFGWIGLSLALAGLLHATYHLRRQVSFLFAGKSYVYVEGPVHAGSGRGAIRSAKSTHPPLLEKLACGAKPNRYSRDDARYLSRLDYKDISISMGICRSRLQLSRYSVVQQNSKICNKGRGSCRSTRSQKSIRPSHCLGMDSRTHPLREPFPVADGLIEQHHSTREWQLAQVSRPADGSFDRPRGALPQAHACHFYHQRHLVSLLLFNGSSPGRRPASVVHRGPACPPGHRHGVRVLNSPDVDIYVSQPTAPVYV